MNLSDSEILELNELCNAVADGTINDAQKDTLSKWLMRSEEARCFYVRVTGLSASLCHYAAEMQTGEPDGTAGQPPHRPWRWVIGLLSIAASIAVIIFLARPNHSTPVRGQTVVANEVEYVAQLTGGKDFHWATGTSTIAPRGRLRKGQQVELTQGFAEITFDSGAQVLLQGPALLNV